MIHTFHNKTCEKTQRREEMITKESSQFGVHATHCCSLHGCKYGQDDVCPVTNGLDEGVRCEDCDWEEERIVDAIELLVARGWIPEGYDPAIHELINVPKESKQCPTILETKI